MIGVIADDLSGAAEIGGICLRHGLRSEIITTAIPTPGMEVVCADTDSRGCPAEEAKLRVAKAVELVQAAGAKLLFKKVDSVLRGNVVVEIESMLETCGIFSAILAPSNPSRGRIIKDGRYFIKGIPIEQTEFARDPGHPRLTSDVLELARPFGKMPVRVVKSGEAICGQGIALVEAGNADDMVHWAGQVKAGILPAGGADFFRAWLDAMSFSQVTRVALPDRNAISGKELFVCGSMSEATRQFVEKMRTLQIPVFSLPPEVANGEELNKEQVELISNRVEMALAANYRVILEAGLPMVADARVGAGISSELVRVAARVLKGGNIDHVFCEGGATAALLMKRMDWKRLCLVEEIAPGVVTTRTGEGVMTLTLKPGSYAWPDSIVKIV